MVLVTYERLKAEILPEIYMVVTYLTLRHARVRCTVVNRCVVHLLAERYLRTILPLSEDSHAFIGSRAW